VAVGWYERRAGSVAVAGVAYSAVVHRCIITSVISKTVSRNKPWVTVYVLCGGHVEVNSAVEKCNFVRKPQSCQPTHIGRVTPTFWPVHPLTRQLSVIICLNAFLYEGAYYWKTARFVHKTWRHRRVYSKTQNCVVIVFRKALTAPTVAQIIPRPPPFEREDLFNRTGGDATPLYRKKEVKKTKGVIGEGYGRL